MQIILCITFLLKLSSISNSPLLSFFTSIISSFIWSISGALQYAKMLDTQEVNHTLLFMPVSPSFIEPDDVLGYLNPNNGTINFDLKWIRILINTIWFFII